MFHFVGYAQNWFKAKVQLGKVKFNQPESTLNLHVINYYGYKILLDWETII